MSVASELWKPQRAPINALEYVNWRSIYSFSLTLFLVNKLFSSVLVLFVLNAGKLNLTWNKTIIANISST